MKYYHYFVSFTTNSGFGMCDCKTKKLISSFEDIMSIRQSIAESKPTVSVNEIIILNYNLIRNKPY